MRFLALAAAGVMSMALVPSARAAVIFDTITGVTDSIQSPVRIAAPGSPQQPTSTNPTTQSVPYGGGLATSFVLSNSTTITNVTLRLWANAPSDGGAVVVYIVPDNAGAPSHNGGTGLSFAFTGGTLIGSILDSALSTTSSNQPLTTSVSMSAGTYWLAAVADADASTPGVQSPTFSPTTKTSTARWQTANSFITGNLSGQATGQDFGLFTPGTAAPGVFTTAQNPTTGVFMSGVFMATIEGVANNADTPEPVTLAILGAGLIGLGIARRPRGGKKAKA